MRVARVHLAVSFLCLALGAFSDQWSFVVAGDGRSDPGRNRPEDRDGINTKITREIAEAVIRENAHFLLWTGDTVLGSKDPKVYESQLMAWRGIMEPLYRAGIGVLPVRGNHEARSANSAAIWNRVFSGPFALPQNGPAGEQNLTFFHVDGPVLVLGLDNYSSPKSGVNLPWLTGVLRDHRKPFIFAFCHEMAFMAGNHTDNLEADVSKRDELMGQLLDAGSRCFFAGHDHFYDHIVMSKPGQPEMHQFVAGTAGAPFYPDKGYKGNKTFWNTQRIWHLSGTYGYLLVEIEGKNATVTFKGRTASGEYVPMDRYSYRVSGR